MKRVRTWIALVSLGAVLLVAVVDVERTSPGPLSAVHGREQELAESCSACHGGWFSSMKASCLECHEPIDAQLASGAGLHGVLQGELAQRCALCHSEHHGAGFEIVNKRSFAMAGIPDREAFDHRLLGFSMEGRHLELACAECHRNAAVDVLPAGEVRFLGLDRDCASCHEDPHAGRFAIACASCHGQERWDELFSLGHEEHLPLVGGHAGLDCRQCHEGTSPHALEILGGRAARPAPRECSACHESPHRRRFVLGAARPFHMTPGSSCVLCHQAEHTDFREYGLEVSPEQHAASGFPLTSPHDEVGCAECHAPELETFLDRHPGRSPEACSACHEDVHEGQFERGAFAGQECTACHDREHFDPPAFGPRRHARTAFALDGSHLRTECAECHFVPDHGGPRIFNGTPATCESCHADAHQDFFHERLASLPAPSEAGECANCHLTTRFEELPAGGFDHGLWTGFPVLGAHAQAACEACHPRAQEPDELGRSFGRVADRFGFSDDWNGCAQCHQDPHGGGFDTPDLPAESAGRTGCARCHVAISFRAFPQGWDHGRWTGFGVVGAHAAAGCSACHAQWRQPDEHGRTWGPSNGARCSDCHEDPHAGQFAVEGATDCERCHDSFRKDYLSFDHDRDSRFPLDRQHEKLACAACHKPWKAPDGSRVTRYVPLGRECVDCHGVQEDVLIRRRRAGR